MICTQIAPGLVTLAIVPGHRLTDNYHLVTDELATILPKLQKLEAISVEERLGLYAIVDIPAVGRRDRFAFSGSNVPRG